MSQSYRVQLQQSGESFECAQDDTLLRAGLRAGQGMAYECNVGSCGSCKFDLIEGEVETLWEEAPGLNPRDRKRGRRLGCQSIPKSDCVIKTMINEYYAPRDLPRRFDAVLTQIRDLTHDIREFRFTDGGGASFRPGQYALFNLEPRGQLFVIPNDPVYEGMIIGEHNRSQDINVNACKEKKLTNMRAAGKDENVILSRSRDPEKDYLENILPRKLEYYREYAEQRSMMLDLRIIGKTLLAIIR